MNVNPNRSRAARKSKKNTPWSRQTHCKTPKAEALYRAWIERHPK